MHENTNEVYLYSGVRIQAPPERDRQRTGTPIVSHDFVAKLPAEYISITAQALDNGAPDVINFLYIIELVEAEAHNLSGLQATLIQQVGDAKLAFVGEQMGNGLPEFTAIIMILV